MKVTNMNIEGAVQKIVDVYLTNPAYEENVEFIVKQYLYDESNADLQDRLDEVEGGTKWKASKR